MQCNTKICDSLWLAELLLADLGLQDYYYCYLHRRCSIFHPILVFLLCLYPGLLDYHYHILACLFFNIIISRPARLLSSLSYPGLLDYYYHFHILLLSLSYPGLLNYYYHYHILLLSLSYPGLLDARREAVDEEALRLRVLPHRLQQQVCHLFLDKDLFYISSYGSLV